MYCNFDNDLALDMLMDRLDFWTDDTTTKELYEQMYEHAIDEGLFDGGEFNVMSIVDNDYVNWCTVYEEEDEEYKDIKEAWDNGDREVDGIGYIEAEADGAFLIRSY